MKKTLLSILALSAGVAFAQKTTTFVPNVSALESNKAADTLLFLQGGLCPSTDQNINGSFQSETFSVSQGGATYSFVEDFQKLSYTVGGTVSSTVAIIGAKREGIANGTTEYFMKIYSVKADGTPNALLGTSEAIDYANIDTTEANGGLNIFTFTTPVNVPNEFIVALTLADGSADTDTITLLGSLPYDGTKTGNARFYGDCAMGTSGSKIVSGANSMFQLYNEPDPSAPNDFLDPKLFLGAVLTPTVSIENNSTVAYSIFPNPTSDVLNVQYTLAKEGNVTMNITDLTGRTIKSIVKENQGTFQVTEQINIAGLNSGIYMLTVNVNGNTTTQKFIVK